MGQSRRPFTQVAGVSGAVTIAIDPGPQTWIVQQVVSRCSAAPVGAASELNVNGDLISKMVPAGSVASGEPYVTIRSGDLMYVKWTGITPGAVCKVTVIYEDGN